MRVYLIGETEYSYATSYIHVLQELGYEVKFFTRKDFYRDCAYWQRKLYKLGFVKVKKSWEKQYETDFEKFFQDIKSDDLLWVNGEFKGELLKQVRACYKIITLWDTVKRFKWNIFSTLKLYDKVFVFEYDDIKYLKTNYDIKAQYFPLGYDPQIFYPQARVRDIDISFIGRPSPSRVRLLDKIATICKLNNWRMFVGGPWYEARYPWKKWIFKRKYPALYDYIENRIFAAQEVADIYRRSKICLNMNTEIHHSISPRTLEIMATNTFQLMNTGQSYHGIIENGGG